MKQKSPETFNLRLALLDRTLPGHRFPTLPEAPANRPAGQDHKKPTGCADTRPKGKRG